VGGVYEGLRLTLIQTGVVLIKHKVFPQWMPEDGGGIGANHITGDERAQEAYEKYRHPQKIKRENTI
jgi:hypothetical protein